MDTGKHRKNGQKFGLLISDTRASVTLSPWEAFNRQRATGAQQCFWVIPGAGRPLPEKDLLP